MIILRNVIASATIAKSALNIHDLSSCAGNSDRREKLARDP